MDNVTRDGSGSKNTGHLSVVRDAPETPAQIPPPCGSWELAYWKLHMAYAKLSQEIRNAKDLLEHHQLAGSEAIADILGAATTTDQDLDQLGPCEAPRDGWPDADALTVEQRIILTSAADALQAITRVRGVGTRLDESAFWLRRRAAKAPDATELEAIARESIARAAEERVQRGGGQHGE